MTAFDTGVVTQLRGASRRADGLRALTVREREVLGLMADGRSNGAIAGIHTGDTATLRDPSGGTVDSCRYTGTSAGYVFC